MNNNNICPRCKGVMDNRPVSVQQLCLECYYVELGTLDQQQRSCQDSIKLMANYQQRLSREERDCEYLGEF